MNHRKSRMGTNRDFGTEGAGKGDSDRTTNRAAYSENLAEIPLGGHVEGFRKVGCRQVKTYGKRDPEPFRCLANIPQGCVVDYSDRPSETVWLRSDGSFGTVSVPPTNDIVRE